MTAVAGIDLSLASTGVARLDWPDEGGAPRPRTFRIQSTAERDATVEEQADRMLDIRRRIGDAIAGSALDLVAIEGTAPSRGADKGKIALWGLWWQVVTDLRALGLPVAVVSPGTLKIYAVGFGGSAKQKVEKSDVRRAVEKRYPQILTGGSHDVADAIVLVAMCARQIGRPIDQLPTIHQRAMKSATWPNIPGGNPA